MAQTSSVANTPVYRVQPTAGSGLPAAVVVRTCLPRRMLPRRKNAVL